MEHDYYGNEIPEPKEPGKHATADKVFAGFMAVCAVIFGIIMAAAAVSMFIAMWQAGFFNFIFWSTVIIGIIFASKAVYRLILRKNWI